MMIYGSNSRKTKWGQYAVFTVFFIMLFIGKASASTDAATVMNWIRQGNFADVCLNATEQMNQALPESALQATIESLGPFSYIEQAQTEEIRGFICSSFNVIQGGTGYTYMIVIDEEGLLSGLNIQPWQVDLEKTVIEPDDKISVQRIIFREGAQDETSAVLTLPNGEEKCPVVIMLQGSGPSDFNESAYGIRPFEDIANGLARVGIATIRFDKYTYAHAALAAANDSFTIEDEYINDARAALETVKENSRFTSIFLLGHSQGGMLIPRIMSELDPNNFAGGVILAGSPLHLWEIQLHQNEAILSSMNDTQVEMYRPLIATEVMKVKSLQGCDIKEIPQQTVFGLPAIYQWDQIKYDAAVLYQVNRVPCLAIQGDMDWQVSLADGVDLWAERCQGMEVVVLPGLTHLFTRIESASGTVSDYVAGSHVDSSAIETISAWILAR